MNIIELAKQAGFFVADNEVYSPSNQADHELTGFVKAFAALVAAHEREACAKLCDDLPPPEGYNIVETSFWDVTSLACGDAIRARGTT
jgi:hypothetical protein